MRVKILRTLYQFTWGIYFLRYNSLTDRDRYTILSLAYGVDEHVSNALFGSDIFQKLPELFNRK